MYSIKRVLFFLTLISALLPAPVLFAATLECGPGKPLKTLSSAVSVAQANDKILLFAGTYHESLVHIRKPLTIEGIGMPVIDGGENKDVITIEGANGNAQ